MYVSGRLALLVGVGVLPVVGLAGAGLSPWPAAAMWLLACAGAAAADVVLAPDPRTLRVRRDVPSRVRLGERADTTLEIGNPGDRRIHGVLRDGWQPTAGAPAARPRFDVPPGERRRIAVTLQPRRRGQLRTGFVAARSAGPLGLAGRQRVLDAPGTVRVLPPFASRRHLPSRIARLRELDGSTSVQIRGQGTEFDSLREYVRGDDVRSIDWRATARAGTTMLRTWRPERDRHVVILIDTGRTSAARVGDGVRLDAAMEAALLVGSLAARAGDHVHLVMFDRVVRARVTGVDGAALLPALVDAMAPVEPQLIDTDWDAAFGQVRALTSHPALVLLLTAQDATEAARGFLGSLPQLAGRTRVLVGAATADDDAGERTPPRGRRTAEEVYAAAARARSRADADLVGAAIERAGGEFVTASAGDLPPLLADRYLALKAAGRL